MAIGDRIYIADKTTLDEVSGILDRVGTSKSKTIYESLPNTPYAFKQGCVVNYRGEIHLLGGTTINSGGVNEDNRKKHYKFSGGIWVEVSTLPYDFISGSAVVYRDGIHIIGGTSQYYAHWRWNGSTWTSLSTANSPVMYSCAVVYNDLIHVFGGNSSDTLHYTYSLDTNTWTFINTYLPFSLIQGTAVVHKGEIHVIGSTATNLYRVYYRYNGSWTKEADVPINMYSGYSASYRGELHIFSNLNSTVVNHYVLRNSTWIQLPTDILSSVTGVIVNGDDMHIIMDSSVSGTRPQHYRYEYDTWKTYKSYTRQYFLLAGTKIYCDSSKTFIISGDSTLTDYGYTINSPGYVTIEHTDKFGECYNIV